MNLVVVHLFPEYVPLLGDMSTQKYYLHLLLDIWIFPNFI